MSQGQPDATEPQWVRDLRAAAQGFAESLTEQAAHAGHILTAQGAMGWVYRGDLDRAREALSPLPPDALQQVSLAASALSTLADEVASNAEHGT